MFIQYSLLNGIAKFYNIIIDCKGVVNSTVEAQ